MVVGALERIELCLFVLRIVLMLMMGAERALGVLLVYLFGLLPFCG